MANTPIPLHSCFFLLVIARSPRSLNNPKLSTFILHLLFLHYPPFCIYLNPNGFLLLINLYDSDN